MVGITSKAYAQNKPIKGQITDSQTNEKLPAVNIVLKGTTTGTTSDKKGDYQISVPSLQDTLVFSYVGYVEKVVPIDGRTNIDISLKSKTLEGEDLVVTAYGERKASEDVVGAVTSLNEHQLNTLSTAPSANLTTSFAGRIPGLISFQRSGEPGANNADFFIRGVTTFGYSKSPLILIDGVRSSVDQLSHLNPDDIKDFSILKDATATSLYGSEAANGVLIIKTKTGKKQALHTTVRLDNTLSRPTEVPKFAGPVTYMKDANETSLSRTPLAPLPYSRRKIDKTAAGANPYLYPSENWRDKLFKNYTMNQRYKMSLQGGGEVAQYFVSGSFNKSNGLLKVPKLNNFNNNIDLKTYSLRTNVNVDLTNTTDLEIKINGLFDNYQGPLNGGATVYNQSVNANPVRFPAKFPIDSAHSYVDHPLFGGYPGLFNPYAQLAQGYRHYQDATINAKLGATQEVPFIKGLQVRAFANVQRYAYSSNTRQYSPYFYQAVPVRVGGVSDNYRLKLLNPEGGTNYLNYTPDTRTITSSILFQGQANYNRTFGEKHGVSGLLVFKARNQTYDNVTTLKSSLPHRNVNFAGRLTYNYNHIYYAEFNLGANASERFARNHRWGFFPSVGVAWNVSNQKFWEPVSSVITNLKLRATYGYSGNDNIAPNTQRFVYQSEVNLNDPGYHFRTGINGEYNLNGISLQAYPNPSITWERAKKLNFGIHLGLFNKLMVKSNFYYQDRTDILQERQNLPPSLGLYNSPSTNTGEVTNRGFSTRITYNAQLSKDWRLAFRGNFTYAKSEFKKYSEPDYPTAPYLSHIGQPVGEQFGFVAERLFIDQSDVDNSPEQEFGDYGPGDIKYRDLNGDGKITNLDQAPLGYPTNPEINYGFGFSVGFKNLEFDAFFEGLARETFWIDVSAGTTGSNQGTAPYIGGHQLLKAFADDHWTEDNKDLYALYPHFSTDQAYAGAENNFHRSTWFMRNGAFLRIKELKLAYNLPQSLVSKISMRNLRIYINSRNVAHFSSFDLWDPEMAGKGLGYPLQRSFNIGAQFKF